jgi:hypothetical protein
LGKHVHSCYKNLISKKFILQIGHFVLSLTSLSLSLITIFAFCCWRVIVCCFLVTSCRLVGEGRGIPTPLDVFGWTLFCPLTIIQIAKPREGHPLDQGECCPSLVLWRCTP